LSRYVVKRILTSIPIFLGITIIVYTLVNFAPGGPMDIIASSGNLKASDLETLRISLGLDKPVLARYGLWLVDLFKWDLGISYRTSQSVGLMISQRLIPSLILTGTGITGALIIGIPLGIMSAYKPNSFWDKISTFLAFIGSSMPSFFLSLLCIYIFGVKLRLLPTSGMYSTSGNREFSDLIRHLLMPATLIGLQVIGNTIKQTRGSVLEVLNEEYIKTARSKGLKESAVLLKHAVRNALIPIVTIIGLTIPFLIGGAVVIEQIFAWPGIGSLMVVSITNRDYPVIMGITVLISVVVLIANIVLDLVYAALDPRISYK